MALEKIDQNTIPGAGITGNLIYTNAPAMTLQISLAQQPRSARESCPHSRADYWRRGTVHKGGQGVYSDDRINTPLV